MTSFRRLWLAQTVSVLGDFLALFAVQVAIVFRMHGSARDAAAVFIALLAPTVVLGPLAGTFADRWDPRRTMIASEVARGAPDSAADTSGDGSADLRDRFCGELLFEFLLAGAVDHGSAAGSTHGIAGGKRAPAAEYAGGAPGESRRGIRAGGGFRRADLLRCR